SSMARVIERAVCVRVGPRPLPMLHAVVARRVNPENSVRSRAIDLLRKPAAAVERAEEKRSRVDDDVGFDALDVLLSLAELVGGAVVNEPVLGRRSDVVEDLRDLLAMSRIIAVVVTTSELVGVVEASPVVGGDRGQLRSREAVEAVEVAERSVEDDDPYSRALQALAVERVGSDSRDAAG